MSEEKETLKERLVAIMQHNKKSKIIILMSLVLLIAVISGAVVLGASIGKTNADIKKNQKGTATNSQQNTNANTPTSSSSSPADSNSIVYRNTQYGFSFSLPGSWKGYSIVTDKWEGNDVKSGEIVETGPMISIRHPQWTSQNPRQDIPIIIFTLTQWNSLQQGEFHIGAAPILPSELGRNSSYVFALPARYNYAFPLGYKEVEQILENKPFQTNQATDLTTALLLNMMQLANQGKVINSDFPAKTTTIENVEKAWGNPNQTDIVAVAKGTYATFLNYYVAFGFNKAGQIFEVRSLDSHQFVSITLAKAKEVLGTPAYDTKYNGQEIIGYTAGSEFKIEMVFPQPTTNNPNPPMDHYNVFYPQGTTDVMGVGRQW
jgi:hypothetical protein